LILGGPGVEVVPPWPVDFVAWGVSACLCRRRCLRRASRANSAPDGRKREATWDAKAARSAAFAPHAKRGGREGRGGRRPAVAAKAACSEVAKPGISGVLIAGSASACFVPLVMSREDR
jgi:hypothetical protein